MTNKNKLNYIIENKAMDLMTRVGTLNGGHFKLSSGNHSDTYYQMSGVFEFPDVAEQIISLFIEKNELKKDQFDVIVAPAMGGILVGYELSRQLNINNIFFERVNGVFVLKRGFDIRPNSRILLMEDVVTTGKSFREIISIIEQQNLNVSVSVGCIIDRSDSSLVDYTLLNCNPTIWSPEECPLCKNGEELIINGSRFNT